jgi:hypothetical protein
MLDLIILTVFLLALIGVGFTAFALDSDSTAMDSNVPVWPGF